ncbi:MAG TPA: PepSY domain-containing protein [Rhodovulum sp.]|nr:PepSY domain-containing protein [Rhodovulum sp.]
MKPAPVADVVDIRWTVRKFEIDDGRYEIKGRDSDGRQIEVKLDPATLQVVEMALEGDDRRGGARTPAPAGSIATPQNGLSGNGVTPQMQAN